MVGQEIFVKGRILAEDGDKLCLVFETEWPSSAVTMNLWVNKKNVREALRESAATFAEVIPGRKAAHWTEE